MGEIIKLLFIAFVIVGITISIILGIKNIDNNFSNSDYSSRDSRKCRPKKNIVIPMLLLCGINIGIFIAYSVIVITEMFT